MNSNCSASAPKIFANGFEAVELLGGDLVRFTTFEHRAIYEARAWSRSGEVIVPRSALPLMIKQASACLLWGDAVPVEKLPVGQFLRH